MRALISTGMEGATGGTCPDACRPGSPLWDRFRKLLTADVVAVTEGLCDAGADDIVVNEAPPPSGVLSHTFVGYEIFSVTLNCRAMS